MADRFPNGGPFCALRGYPRRMVLTPERAYLKGGYTAFAVFNRALNCAAATLHSLRCIKCLDVG
jgi:hypothetical protein